MTKLDEKQKLTPIQLQAVNFLSVGESVTSVAEKLNVSRQTVSGWLNKDANFYEALWFRQFELWNGEVRRVRAMTSKALDVLYEALENDDYKVRLSAAKMLISMLGLPALIMQNFKPLEREYWRPISEAEKEQYARFTGTNTDDLSNAMVKLS